MLSRYAKPIHQNKPLITYIDASFIQQHLHYVPLVAALRTAFAQQNISVPPRHHHDMASGRGGLSNTLLLMPAWTTDQYIGIKIVTVHPANGAQNLPAIQGLYVLLDARTGQPLATMDAQTLTTKRTAATSALAASFLSRPNTRSMLMIGTGALAPELIRAHVALRPIREVYIWGRHWAKAQQLAEELHLQDINIRAVKTVAEGIAEADLISCATLSPTPLVHGKYLRPGQHIDLVGAYKPDMREADDETIQRSQVFVDCFASGLRESGDIVQPLQNGVLTEAQIHADLFDLCATGHPGRSQADEITLFKSVGHALEDWVAAQMVWEHYLQVVDP